RCRSSSTPALCVPLAAFVSYSAVRPDLLSFPTRRSSDLWGWRVPFVVGGVFGLLAMVLRRQLHETPVFAELQARRALAAELPLKDRKSTRLNSSHVKSSYAVFCLKKKIHANAAILGHRHRRSGPAPVARTPSGLFPARPDTVRTGQPATTHAHRLRLAPRPACGLL